MSNLVQTVRSVIAGLFLFIFTAVLAEKTFHAHEIAPGELTGKVITTTQANGNCDICEFQLAADADNTPTPELTSSPAAGFVLYNPAQIFNDQEYLHSGTDRGPPSL